MAKQFLDYEGLSEYHSKIKAYIESALGAAMSQALQFKGEVPTSGLPTEPKVGDTYVVVTAGTYAGETCEVGDTIICKTAKTSTAAATWLVVQKNIDGAVTTTSTLTANTVMLGNGNKTVKPLANGTANQILAINSSKVPAWTDLPSYFGGAGIDTTINSWGAIFDLKAATSGELGGIKLGYTASGKNYPVVLDSNSKAYVNVPWSDTTYTLPAATATTLGGVKIGTGIAVSSGTISNSGVRSITGSGATLSVNTGGTASTITINHVANATSASYATESVYMTQYSGSDAEATGLLISKQYSTRVGDTYVTRYSASSLIATDSSGAYDMTVANATNATTANKTTGTLTIGDTTFNGSADVTLSAITTAEIDALFT